MAYIHELDSCAACFEPTPDFFGVATADTVVVGVVGFACQRAKAISNVQASAPLGWMNIMNRGFGRMVDVLWQWAFCGGVNLKLYVSVLRVGAGPLLISNHPDSRRVMRSKLG